MRRTHPFVLILCLILFLLLGVTPPPVDGFFYMHIWRFNFSGSLVVAGNQSYNVSPYWAYVGNTSWQECTQLTLDITLNNQTVIPDLITVDVDGNPQLHINLTTPLQPFDVLTWQEKWLFTVADRRPSLPAISVEKSGSINDGEMLMTEWDYERYTSRTELWKTNNTALIELATTIQDSLPPSQRENVLALIYATVTWISQNITIPLGPTEPQYPEELLVTRLGDCDDLSNLLIALLRILGISSYLTTGHWFQEGATYSGFLWRSVERNAYFYVNWQNVLGHGWVMAFVPPWGWLPFDLTAENLAIDPANSYSKSLYTRAAPMVTLWQCISSDYIGERRMEKQDLFNFSLHRTEIEEWTTLGSIPILDFPYYAVNAATLLALIVTLMLLSCLAGLGMRRQPEQQAEEPT